MLIRSQDRKKLVVLREATIEKFKDVYDAISREETEERYIHINHKCMGKYPSERKAMEVIERICLHYENEKRGLIGGGIIFNMPPYNQKN